MMLNRIQLAAGEAAIQVALLLGTAAVAADVASCAGVGAKEVAAPDPKYGIGLGLCLADLKLAKEAMKASDAGVDKAKLYERFETCAYNNEQTSGFDAGSR